MRSVDQNVVVAHSRLVLRQPLREELSSAGGDQLRAPRVHVEWGLVTVYDFLHGKGR